MISEHTTIGFIGAGNMATALIQGLLDTGIAASRLWVSDLDAEKLAPQKLLGVNTTQNSEDVVAKANIVVLAVKPQVMESVVSQLSTALSQKPCLLISIAAGIQIESLQHWSHPEQAIVRCMPNTPALVQAAASALYANDFTSKAQCNEAEAVLKAVGLVCWLSDEQQIDAVTALSGSGPAYFFLLIEAMQKAGEQLGLPTEVAALLSVQTAYGAAKLVRLSDVGAAELRRRVTSPGGTTEAALGLFEKKGFNVIVNEALATAAARSKELAELSKS